jgi:hypothetical protein
VNKEVQEFRSSGVQEFRSSGVQEFRSSGVFLNSKRNELRSDLTGEQGLQSPTEIMRLCIYHHGGVIIAI